jgi:hypothetical protein
LQYDFFIPLKKNTRMKKIFYGLKLLALSSLLLLSACKKEDLFAEYVATYTGSLGYNVTTPNPITNTTSGQATITQSNKVVSISFSNGVPSITGLRFKKSGSNYASIATDGSVAGINFEGSKANIAYTKDGNTWAFTGTK